MVEFDLLAALAGGLVATVVMTAMMQIAARAGMTDMPPMPLVVGSMMSGDRKKATAIGAMAPALVGGTATAESAWSPWPARRGPCGRRHDPGPGSC